MEAGTIEGMGSEEIRAKNKAIVLTTRENAAWIGALWYQIEQRSLWRDWGHASFVEAVVEEAPRAYSSVREAVLNYTHFVCKQQFSFQQFFDLVVQHGMRNVSLIRQAEDMPQPSDQSGTPDLGQVDQDQITKLGGILTMIPRLWKIAIHHLRCDPDQEAIYKIVLAHVQRRVGHAVSPDQAINLVLAEYATEKATRQPIPIKEAA